jgi:hypothetical protein
MGSDEGDSGLGDAVADGIAAGADVGMGVDAATAAAEAAQAEALGLDAMESMDPANIANTTATPVNSSISFGFDSQSAAKGGMIGAMFGGLPGAIAGATIGGVIGGSNSTTGYGGGDEGGGAGTGPEGGPGDRPDTENPPTEIKPPKAPEENPPVETIPDIDEEEDELVVDEDYVSKLLRRQANRRYGYGKLFGAALRGEGDPSVFTPTLY